MEHNRDAVHRSNRVIVDEVAFRRLVAALDAPAESVPELVELFARTSQIPGG